MPRAKSTGSSRLVPNAVLDSYIFAPQGVEDGLAGRRQVLRQHDVG